MFYFPNLSFLLINIRFSAFQLIILTAPNHLFNANFEKLYHTYLMEISR